MILELILGATLAYLVARDLYHERTKQELLDRFERERQLLLTRIQAPDVGVALALEDEDAKSYVGYDSDEEFHSAMRELNGDQ